jgi:hypothetical protein
MTVRPHRILVLLALVASLSCDGELTHPSLYNQVEVSVTADGAPVPGARVELYTGARPMGFAFTGPDGKYLFRRVPQNGYGVILWPVPAGYDTISRGPGQKPANVFDGLDVRGAITLQVEFKLTKR